MSLFLHVFAKSGQDVDPEALAETARTAWYGEGSVTTEHDGGHDRPDWRRMVITLPGASRPITLHRDNGTDTVSTMRDEQLTERDGAPEQVVQRLRDTRQVLSFEVFPEALDDDGWELLDVLESHLARTLDGLVITDDGVYDQDLQLLAP